MLFKIIGYSSKPKRDIVISPSIKEHPKLSNQTSGAQVADRFYYKGIFTRVASNEVTRGQWRKDLAERDRVAQAHLAERLRRVPVKLPEFEASSYLIDVQSFQILTRPTKRITFPLFIYQPLLC